MNPLEHYVDAGWRNRLRPSAAFNSEYYRKIYSVSDNEDPLLHALVNGNYLPHEHASWIKDELRPARIANPGLSALSDDLAVRLYAGHIGPPSFTADKLRAVNSALSGNSILIFVPSFRVGGVERVAFNFAKALGEINPGPVAVVSTDSEPENHLIEVPQLANVRLEDISRAFHGLTKTHQIAILYEAISANKEALILNFNSDILWDVTIHRGSQLKMRDRGFAFLACDERTADGEGLAGYGREKFPQCAGHLRGLIGDHAAYIRQLREDYAPGIIPDEALFAAYQPVSPEQVSPGARIGSDHCKTLLWAGRLVPQKSPETAIAVARSLPDWQVVIAGSGERRYQAGLRSAAPSNVRFVEGYRRFSDLLAFNPSLLLYTARWDGLPNVLLEASSVGLPFVAPKIGGISEFAGDSYIGLTPERPSVPDFVAAVRRTHQNRHDLSQVLLRLMANRHTWDAFVANIEGWLASLNFSNKTRSADNGRSHR